MEELLKQLAEIRKAIKSLSALGEDITDEQAEKLDGLNKQAVKLQARVDAAEQVAQDEKARDEQVKRERDEAVAEAVKAEQVKNRRLSMSEAPYVAKFSDTNKFDELSAGETALVIETLASQNKHVSPSAFKALSLKIGELKDDNTEEGRKAVNYVKNNFAAFTGIKADMASIEAAVKAATDPMYTGGSNVGSDWVGTAYSSDLWQSIRAANTIISRIPETVVADGYSSQYIPLESSDPTWYKVAEATASDGTLKLPAATVTASQAGTLNKQITLGKLGARVLYTGEMVEDSLIAFAPEMRRKLMVSGSEILEHVAIDGDVETSASKNINAVDTAVTSGAPYLLLDGFRKLALVTNTANSRSAGGAFVVEDFIETLKLLGVAGLAGSDPNQVKFIVDFNTHFAGMKLPEAKTRDVYSQATFENGFLKQAFGYEVIPSFQMHRISNTAGYERKVNTAGKVDADTGSNNTTGAILAVRFDQWKQAFKRRMTMETTRIANADSWEIVALVRWGMAYRDNEASAISYNVGL